MSAERSASTAVVTATAAPIRSAIFLSLSSTPKPIARTCSTMRGTSAGLVATSVTAL
ncbi:MAG: hypothetical protein QM765_18960 [Myxococcales bacterium]